jgi:phage N-6-adenine-methyltransferase
MTTQNYGTPPWLVDAIARSDFGGKPPSLDVCAEKWSAKAPRFWSKKEDGLRQSWSTPAGGWVWCNPPYANQVAWLEAAAGAAMRGHNVACLVLASTSAAYWRPLVWQRGTCDLFEGRIAFLDPHTKRERPGFDRASALVLFGPRFRPGVVRVRSALTGDLIHTVGSVTRHARPTPMPQFGRERDA